MINKLIILKHLYKKNFNVHKYKRIYYGQNFFIRLITVHFF